MKKVIILYRNSKDSVNTPASEFIYDNLRSVFSDYAVFENCFMADLKENEILHADAFLAVDARVFQKAKECVADFSNVIKMGRSIEQSVLITLQDIPADTNVLVVNDSYSTAVNTVNMFYELGISHLNFVPFDKELAHTTIYDDLSLAVTPSEKHFVPAHIKNIIDIGYRKVSFDTMFRLMKLLDLDNSVVNRNLFRYMQTLAEPDTIFNTNYIYEYLKTQTLSFVTNSNKSCVFLTDQHMNIIYANDPVDGISRKDHSSLLDAGQLVELKDSLDSESGNPYTTINGTDYYYDKYPIKLIDEVIGYFVVLKEKNQLLPVNKVNLQKGYVAKYHFQDIVHMSEEIQNSIQTAKLISLAEHTVLIYGESGTGKEVFAQAIHNASKRANAPFVAVNCAALPENLLESELFGYEPGAFTGAIAKGKAGLFEQANHGTIFLDEISDISPNLQSKLLRVIQEKQVMRIGTDHIINIDVRLIAATNRDLKQAVQEKTFRSDLFYRLNVLPIRIPPLRKRMKDIIPLLKYFLGTSYDNLTPQELRQLTAYSWPGNVRELENFCTYYKTLSSFPEYLYEEISVPEDCPSTAEVQIEILKLIRKNTKISHGIGRTGLAELLKKQGLYLSDRALRPILNQLQQDGLIEIGKGRHGMRITKKGSSLLTTDSCQKY